MGTNSTHHPVVLSRLLLAQALNKGNHVNLTGFLVQRIYGSAWNTRILEHWPPGRSVYVRSGLLVRLPAAVVVKISRSAWLDTPSSQQWSDSVTWMAELVPLSQKTSWTTNVKYSRDRNTHTCWWYSSMSKSSKYPHLCVCLQLALLLFHTTDRLELNNSTGYCWARWCSAAPAWCAFWQHHGCTMPNNIWQTPTTAGELRAPNRRQQHTQQCPVCSRYETRDGCSLSPCRTLYWVQRTTASSLASDTQTSS